jgi:hypothetical protein
VGQLRRVLISNVVVYNADAKYGSIISGIPRHYVEDIKFENVHIYYQGGGTPEQAALDPPEKEKDYPEPVMFGEIPAYAFFIRHAKGIEMSNVDVSYMKEDLRPPFVLTDVKGADFYRLKAQRAPNLPTFALSDVDDFSLQQSLPLSDRRLANVKKEKL